MTPTVLCTLARQHSGDCAHTETPARHACRKVIRYEPTHLAPADVPPDSGAAGTPEEQCAAERAMEIHLSEVVPTEPTTADLIAYLDNCTKDLDFAREVADKAEAIAASACVEMERARSALAKHVGNGRFVQVGGFTFKAIAPRKPRGGELAADAMWRLELVEVAR